MGIVISSGLSLIWKVFGRFCCTGRESLEWRLNGPLGGRRVRIGLLHIKTIRLIFECQEGRVVWGVQICRIARKII